MASVTDYTAAEEDAHRGASGAAQGGAQSSQAQRLSARAMMNPKDKELLALSQRACAIIPAALTRRMGVQARDR